MQNTAICPSPIHFCRMRVTRLTQAGLLSGTTNNVYVTDKVESMGFAPQYEEGDDKRLISGCDCMTARWRGRDKFVGYDLTLVNQAMEPGLEEMLLGGQAAIINDASTIPVAIGVGGPDSFNCATPPSPVAIEIWQDNVIQNFQAASPFRYVRRIWTNVLWRLDDGTAENDFGKPGYVGHTFGNPSWGDGPHSDSHVVIPANGTAWFFDDFLPTATCGYQSLASSV